MLILYKWIIENKKKKKANFGHLMELNIVWLKLFSVLNHTSFWTTDGVNLFTDFFVMFFKITDSKLYSIHLVW